MHIIDEVIGRDCKPRSLLQKEGNVTTIYTSLSIIYGDRTDNDKVCPVLLANALLKDDEHAVNEET